MIRGENAQRWFSVAVLQDIAFPKWNLVCQFTGQLDHVNKRLLQYCRLDIHWLKREKSSCTSTHMCKHPANKRTISSQTYLCIIPFQLPLLHTVAPTEKGKEKDLFKWLCNVQSPSKNIKEQLTCYIIFFPLHIENCCKTIGNFLHLKRVFPMDDFQEAETEEAHITAEECSEWKTQD